MAGVISFLSWFVIFVAVCWSTGRLHAALGTPRPVRMALLPGYVAIWMVRVLACVLTGAKAEVEAVFRSDREARREPTASLLTRIGLALLPFAVATGTLVALFAVPEKLPIPVNVKIDTEFELSVESLFLFVGSSWQCLVAVVTAIVKTPWSWRLWAALYVSMALLVAGAPDTRDLLIIGPICASLIMVASFLDGLGLSFGLFSRGWFIGFFYSEPLWRGLAFLLSLAVFTCVVSAVVLSLGHVYALWRRRKRRQKKNS